MELTLQNIQVIQLLNNQQDWESNGVLYASVIEENSVLKMVYGNSNGSGFGLATSSDGLNWTKANNNPFFTNQNTSNNWASGKIAYPYWLNFRMKQEFIIVESCKYMMNTKLV